MGGKGSGGLREGSLEKARGRKAELMSPLVDDPGVNSRVMAMGRDLFMLEPVDFSDTDALRERFVEYLDLCEKHQLRPMLAGMASALGISRREFSALVHGDPKYDRWRGGILTPSGRVMMQKMHEFLNVSWENYLVEETGNPVKWLFLGKNYFGMKDQTERIDVRVDATPTLQDAREVAKKYAAMVGKTPDESEAEIIDVEDE